MAQPQPNDEKWSRLRLTVSLADSELGANWLLESGCEGVQIEDVKVKFDQSEDATLEPLEKAIVTGYLRGNLRETTPHLPFEATFESEEIDSQNWAEQWRENFPPLEIGPFLIVPTWEETPKSERIILRLDPGLAFGTGQHPTTRMCLELLAEVLAEQKESKLLDVGCGSGILSVAAAKLGARVVASDPDAFCTAATQENAALNGVEIETHEVGDLNWVREPFPFVIANLMSALLIRLAPELARATQNGGILVVSGISAPRADEVEAALQTAGFTTLQKREMDGESRGEWIERWTAFVLRKVAN